MLSGNNSILNRAAEAKEITGQKDIEERIQIAYLGALASGTEDVTRGKLDDELKKTFESYTLSADGSTVTIDGKDYETGLPGKWSSAEKTAMTSNGVTEIDYDDITNENLKNPDKIKAVITGDVPIPVDATYEEGTVDTGVVIKYKNSEFVWVPVPNAIYDSSKDSQLPKSSTNASLKEGYGYTPMAINTGTIENPEYKSLRYYYNETNGAYLEYSSASPYQGMTSQGREPAYLSDSNYDDNTTYGGLFSSSDLQKAYNNMIKSVEKYGGFFIGRYETSLNEDNKAQSVADVTPTNAYVTATHRWYGLYQKQKEFTESTDKMQSEMIWGSQYDAMINWALTGADKAHVIAGNNATHDGTYNAQTIKTRTTTENDKIVGLDKINNIYDLEGNLLEWTQEAYSTFRREYRGSYFNSRNGYGKPYNRGSSGEPNGAYVNYGSRISLYIK